MPVSLPVEFTPLILRPFSEVVPYHLLSNPNLRYKLLPLTLLFPTPFCTLTLMMIKLNYPCNRTEAVLMWCL